jgi:hypothetical protein
MKTRVAQFHEAIDDRLSFLLKVGFVFVERESAGDLFGRVRLSSGSHHIDVLWEARDGALEAKLDGVDLWPQVVAAGLWEAGRPGHVYAGYSIDSMQHGIDRIAVLLKAMPGLVDPTMYWSLPRVCESRL